jgi:hypothetical protein
MFNIFADPCSSTEVSADVSNKDNGLLGDEMSSSDDDSADEPDELDDDHDMHADDNEDVQPEPKHLEEMHDEDIDLPHSDQEPDEEPNEIDTPNETSAGKDLNEDSQNVDEIDTPPNEASPGKDLNVDSSEGLTFFFFLVMHYCQLFEFKSQYSAAYNRYLIGYFSTYFC